VAKKRSAIILGELARESAARLDSMAVELTDDIALAVSDGEKPGHWSKRFSASGKCNLARPFHKS